MHILNKEIDRTKVIKAKPVDQKVLQKFVNKMMLNHNLEEANKENLFPNMRKIVNIEVDKNIIIENESETSAIFKPSSLDGTGK